MNSLKSKFIIISIFFAIILFYTSGIVACVYYKIPANTLNYQGIDNTIISELNNSTAKLVKSKDKFNKAFQLHTEAMASQEKSLKALTKESKNKANLSENTYEKIIINRLGKATVEKKGKNSEIMIFPLDKANLKGYMAKIKIKSPKALRVTRAKNPSGEKTLNAVKRLGGILGINGGGFAYSTINGVKTMVPMGNTMINGKLINDFIPAKDGFAFAGFKKNGKLVGGSYSKKSQLLKSGAWQGISFVPSLIKNWQKVKIPAKWQKNKEPRTVIGEYPNGDLFFIVVDGRQDNWSKGISLEEMGNFLLELGVKEAYNLDGGGSSTFVFDNTIKNKPSDGNSRNLATNIVVIL